jgi:hypothetical protein
VVRACGAMRAGAGGAHGGLGGGCSHVPSVRLPVCATHSLRPRPRAPAPPHTNAAFQQQRHRQSVQGAAAAGRLHGCCVGRLGAGAAGARRRV